MERPSGLSVLALAPLWMTGSAYGEVEIQTGRYIAERFGSDPVVITADPFFKFDTMGGMRRLDRVTVDVGFDWEVVVELANPLPEPQIASYIAHPEPQATIFTNTDLDLLLFISANPGGILSAQPFQTVQQTESWHQPALRYFDLNAKDPEMASLIGPGPILVELFPIGTSFDTFRLIGGQPMGGPIGFSRVRERWSAQVTYTYEYSLVPSPGGLTLALTIAVVSGVSRRRR